LLFVLLALADPARSCGPDLPEAVFVPRQAPENPQSFGAGQLGVLLPSYYQRYLFLAYRALSVQALTGSDLDAALRLPPTSYGEDQPGYARWRAVRDSLGGDKHKEYVSLVCARREGNVFYFYPNYYDDAFRSAAATLADRVRAQGSVDAPVRDWMQGQDAVFHACGYDSAPPPPPAPAGSPSWLVKDRAYQAACWGFYSGRFDEAADKFHAIADDRDSPWREWGAYLAARALTRKGTVTPDRQTPNREALQQAEKQLEVVLADPSLAARHESAQRLLAFVRLNLDPATRLAQVSHDLLQPHPGGDVPQEVFDLTALLDRFTAAQAESLAKINPDFELADWILSFQSRDAAHALERWRATKSVPWLVAAMSAAHDATPDLMAAADKLPVDHPGFLSVRFHEARLLAASGKEEEARKLLDALPTGAGNIPDALRMRLSRSFDEFQRYAGRVPIEITGYAYNGQTLRADGPLLDRDGAYMLNRWAQTSLVARASQTQEKSLREPMIVAAWTRAVIAGNDSLAIKLSDGLATDFPALGSFLQTFRAAPDAASRGFEAAWLMLHTPGLTPWVRWGAGRSALLTEREMFRDNWWPVESKDQHTWFMGGEESATTEPVSWTNPPGWDTRLAQTIFTAAERAQADRERALVTEAGPGANLLCQQTIAWSKSHPKDSRLPEALHLCVQATRYGYADDQTTRWSRQAFALLHSRFPGSSWSKLTKYWY
jgi:hypothetical protein